MDFLEWTMHYLTFKSNEIIWKQNTIFRSVGTKLQASDKACRQRSIEMNTFIFAIQMRDKPEWNDMNFDM